MNCQQITRLLPDYLTQNLDNETHSKIAEHVAACSVCQLELQSLSAVWSKIGSIPEAQPTPKLRERFYAMLEAYEIGLQQAQPQPKRFERFNDWLSRWWFRRPAWQLGFAIALLLLGLFVGFRVQPATGENHELAILRQEVNNLSKLVTISLLQQPSSTERLRGVSFGSRLEQPDRETLSTLLNTLNSDPSVNVRLAVLDALAPFDEYQQVRQGLIESLQQQSSPLLQVALIDYFVESQTRGSLPVLKSIRQNEETNQTVRKRAGWAIEQIE